MNNIIQLIAKKKLRGKYEESVIKVLEGDLNLWEGIKNLFGGEEKYKIRI